jgi:hypothetical protein
MPTPPKDEDDHGRGGPVPNDDSKSIGVTGREPVLMTPVRLQPFLFINDYPKNRNNGWHTNVQGVTHDDAYWYVTQRYRLWKFPVTHDLNASVDGGEPGVSYVDLEDLGLERYDHFGDLDHYQGRLYVPLEDVSDDEAVPAIAVFDSRDLRFRGYWRLSRQGPTKQAPWCAINPIDGLLYTSSFEINSHRGYLKVYRPRLDSGFSHFPFVEEVRVRGPRGGRIVVSRVQGGVFSPKGNLYLVSDTETTGGILGFDGTTWWRIVHTPIAYDRGTGEELEGITIWNLDGGPAPKIRGQVHVLMVDEDKLSSDDLYFKHFRVRAADRPNL